MSKHIAVTDEKGEARFDVPPGIYTFSVEAEGYEPIQRTTEVSERETNVKITLKSITKGFVVLDNARLRGLIRASANVWEIGRYVKDSERLIALSTGKLKKFAARQFEKTTNLAQARIEQLRRLESSTAFSVGPKGISVSRNVKKRSQP